MQFNAKALLLSNTKDKNAVAMAEDLLAGDVVAGMAFEDYEKENESMSDYPFEEGDKVFFHQVTLYFVGKVKRIGRGWVLLEDCSWVHWTGRLGSLFKSFDLTKTHGNRKPRTEYLGDYVVWLQAGVGCKIWKGDLPKESLS